MTKCFLNLTFLFITSMTYAQWMTLNIPSAGRYDDITFLSDSIAWVAGGNSGEVYQTIDQGITWELKFSSNTYLRSIEALNDSVIICGSLPIQDSAFYVSKDGGNTWQDYKDSIPGPLVGICGLSSPNPSTVFGVGFYIGPACLIKSLDSGRTWEYFDMSAYANGLVDCHFIDEQKGWIVGSSDSSTEGGIILFTDDGGNSWTTLHTTDSPGDIIWKLQSPDDKHFYCSIQGGDSVTNIRLIQSVDSGLTWFESIVDTIPKYIQGVGFIDSLRGWIGGHEIYETMDGGQNWNYNNFGQFINRFHKINDSLAFMTGDKVYRFGDSINIPSPIIKKQEITNALRIKPNPVEENLNVQIDIVSKTFADLRICDISGRTFTVIHRGFIDVGQREFNVNMQDAPPGTYFIVMHYNEGKKSLKVIKSNIAN